MTLFDFDKNSSLQNWRIVDDVVMGGRSDGHFDLNDEGHAVFHGSVSLENNGGFSSVRYNFDQIASSNYSTMNIRIKGDGKDYQFRIKTDSNDRHSYIYDFETSGNWETISIPLLEMQPTFRGRKLDMPDYPNKVMEEIAILISNKRAENFRLEIDKIELQ